MFLLSEEVLICSSHSKSSPGGGEGITGHNWRIVATVAVRELCSRGEILPSGQLAGLLWQVAQPLDHRHLDDLPPFAAPPGATPPRVALHIWERLRKLTDDDRVRLTELAVWTEPGQCTAVREGNIGG
jgi:6-pyruvoyltetrahydropterin/6-carboxytetrahydropterin synthase